MGHCAGHHAPFRSLVVIYASLALYRRTRWTAAFGVVCASGPVAVTRPTQKGDKCPWRSTAMAAHPVPDHALIGKGQGKPAVREGIPDRSSSTSRTLLDVTDILRGEAARKVHDQNCSALQSTPGQCRVAPVWQTEGTVGQGVRGPDCQRADWHHGSESYTVNQSL